MGRITGIGKNTLRAILVEASEKLITKDQVMRRDEDRIRQGASGPLWPLPPCTGETYVA